MSRLPYTRERLRELLDRVDGDRMETAWHCGAKEVFVYDEKELLDLLVHIANRSFAEGMRLGGLDLADLQEVPDVGPHR